MKPSFQFGSLKRLNRVGSWGGDNDCTQQANNSELRKYQTITQSVSSSSENLSDFVNSVSHKLRIEPRTHNRKRRPDSDPGASTLGQQEALDIYYRFMSAKPSEKRTIKVDLCPEVTPEKAKQVFCDVARSCGFVSVQAISETVLMFSELKNNPMMCGSKHDTHFEFPVLQELVVRDYGNSSTKYAALFLSWLDVSPRLVRQGSSNQVNLLAQGLTHAFGKKGKVSKKGLQLLIEEIIGRWRATLFQREYAWEAAALDNGPDAPWQSLNADEVDYEDSDDEAEIKRIDHAESLDRFASQLSMLRQSYFSLDSNLPFPPPPPQSHSTPSFFGFPSYLHQPKLEFGSCDSISTLGSDSVTSLPFAPPIPLIKCVVAPVPNTHMRDHTGAGSPAKTKKKKAHSMQMLRPRSALKLESTSSGIPHEKRKPLSVSFSTAAVEVQHLEISRIHREARMGVGGKAVNEYGQLRPLTSTRTGCLIFLESLEMYSNEFGEEEKGTDLHFQEARTLLVNTPNISSDGYIRLADLVVSSPRNRSMKVRGLRKPANKPTSPESPRSAKIRRNSPTVKPTSSNHLSPTKNHAPRLQRRPSILPEVECKENDRLSPTSRTAVTA